MRKIAIFSILIAFILMACGETTNSMIYTQYSNILTYVYITEYGSYYHAHDCPTTKYSKTTYIKRTEAEARGYTPCPVCFY